MEDINPINSSDTPNTSIIPTQQETQPIAMEFVDNSSQSATFTVYVNPKQYNRMLKRREIRAKMGNISKNTKPYLHESRHNHAKQRNRKGGQFTKQEENREESSNNTETISLSFIRPEFRAD